MKRSSVHLSYPLHRVRFRSSRPLLLAVAAAAAAAAVALGLLTAGEARAARFAVVIGNNLGEADEAPLLYAETDARQIGEILMKLGDFAPENVTVLTGMSAAELRAQVARVSRQMAAIAGEHLLFLFYSGHADADGLHLGTTPMSFRELRATLSGSKAAARVMIVDACRSGNLTRDKGGVPGAPFGVRVERPLGARGLAIISSSAAHEQAQESDQLGASFFTHYLGSALRGAADRNNDGQVTLGEAFEYAAHNTRVATARTVAGPQNPTFRLELGGSEDLVLTRPASEPVAVGHLGFPEPGWYFIQRKGLPRFFAEVDGGGAGRRLAVEPGAYEVTRRQGERVSVGDFVVRAASPTWVVEQQMRTVDQGRVVRKGATERQVALALWAGGGARSPILALGTALGAGVGLRLDLPAVTLELRAAGSTSSARGAHPAGAVELRELLLSLAGMRALDLRRVTMALGVEAGVSRLAQSFDSGAARASVSPFAGPLVAMELPLPRAFFLRVEGGAPVYLLGVSGEGGTPRREIQLAARAFLAVGGYF